MEGTRVSIELWRKASLIYKGVRGVLAGNAYCQRQCHIRLALYLLATGQDQFHHRRPVTSFIVLHQIVLYLEMKQDMRQPTMGEQLSQPEIADRQLSKLPWCVHRLLTTSS